MRILLIDNGSNLTQKLQDLIPGNEITEKFGGFKLEDSDNFDLVILSGGQHNILFENDSFSEEIKLVKSGKSVIGICFGCELIARAFGGELIELPEEEKGIFEIEILDKSLGDKNMKVYEGHRWAVSKVPEEFEVLAKSERGPEIIKHKILPIYGLQFHPENMVDETEGDDLFLRLLSQF
jgi:GMP synthase-like glutamine amidotransferase